MTMPGQPYQNSWDDGEGDVYDPQTNTTDDFLAAWYTRGYTASLGPNGEFVYSPLIQSTGANTGYANLPADLSGYTEVHQNYFSGDHDPLGGFLTFMPSDSFTATENGVSYRVPRRLAGTETWPSLDSGVSPWAFSMEGSGSIYIWMGLLVVKLFPTDGSNIVTDGGQPLTYHVTEHFQEGRQFDITVPTSGTVQDLTALIVPGSIRPAPFDPINPLGSGLEEDLWENVVPPFPVWTQSHLATNYIPAIIGAVRPDGSPIDVSTDQVFLAFTQGTPSSGDWITAAWVQVESVTVGPPYQAQVLVGPDNSGVLLAQGQYQIWSKLVDFPQTFIQQIGVLYIT